MSLYCKGEILMRYFLSVIVLFLFAMPGHAQAQGRLLVEWAVKEVDIKGYTRGKTNVTMSSEVSGKVLRVNYDVGQETGSRPFFEIDPTFVDFQIESTRQNIEQLRVALQKCRSRVAYLQKVGER